VGELLLFQASFTIRGTRPCTTAQHRYFLHQTRAQIRVGSAGIMKTVSTLDESGGSSEPFEARTRNRNGADARTMTEAPAWIT